MNHSIPDRLRVLCIDHEGGYGGSSRSLYQMIEAMDRSNMDLLVWCGRIGPVQERYKNLGIPVDVIDGLPSATTLHRLSRTLLGFVRCKWSLKFNKDLRRRLRALQGFDVIHFNHPNLFQLADWLRPRGNQVQTLHVRTISKDLYEGTPEFPLSGAINKLASAYLARWQTRRMSQSIDQFVFITENERLAYRLLGGGGDGPVIHNVVSILDRDGSSDPRIPRDSRLKVACLENYRWSRGTDRLVEIAKCLALLGRSDVLFVVAGDMTFSRAQRRGYGIKRAGCESLLDYSVREGVAEYFLFLDHVAEPELVLTATDILISVPRRAGPWGRNVIEAMAMGRPVLAVGGQTGFVDSGRNGILIEPFSARDFAMALCELADDPRQVRELGKAARRDILLKCDGKTNSAKLAVLWQTFAKDVRQAELGQSRDTIISH